LYTGGRLTDLLTLVPSASGWKSLVPRCVNDHGQIAGVGTLGDGKQHVFLMSPLPDRADTSTVPSGGLALTGTR
ncbi:MAG: hypothetical protein M3Z35_14715, partial [Nitrospirota bacterium]|nr:hypothetical protein [Nitrospirota bacterium]